MNNHQLHENDPFRVAVLHSSAEDLVILKNNFELPGGEVGRNESSERAAQRIAKSAFDLEHLTAVARLSPTREGVQGFVLEAATGKKTDLRRSFAGRAFELDFILKDSEEKPDKYRTSDISLLRSYKDKTFRV